MSNPSEVLPPATEAMNAPAHVEPAVQNRGAASTASATASTPQPSKGRGVGLGALVLGLIGGLIGALAVSLVPVPLPYSPASRVAALQATFDKADVARLAERIARLEQRTGSLPAGGDVAGLASRLQSAEQQVTALATQLADLQKQGGATGTAGEALASGLATSLAELRGRVDTLSNEIQSAQNLTARIALLETRVPADLASQLALLAPKGDIALLDQRLGKLEANTSAYDAKRAASAIALANLARAASSGAPFTAELDAVRLVNVDAALVEPLAPYAAQGVRPASDLIVDFGDAARKTLRASRLGSGSWWSRFWASITGLFLIRSEGAHAGTSVDAVLSRADAAVHSGNLQAALAETSRLSGPAAEAIAPWRKQAEARIALDGLVTKLSGQILADLRG